MVVLNDQFDADSISSLESEKLMTHLSLHVPCKSNESFQVCEEVSRPFSGLAFSACAALV